MENQEQRTYMVPILPAWEMEAAQGKKVNKAMIDSVKAYDRSFRPAYLYLSREEAHGQGNREIVASILRTFEQEINNKPFLLMEVLPHRRFRDGKFEDLVAPDGDYPGRSVDLWHKSLIPGCPTEYNLEGVALCGANKPATINLPPVLLSTNLGSQVLAFSVNTGSNHEQIQQLLSDIPGLPATERQMLLLAANVFPPQLLQKEIERLRRTYIRPKTAEEAVQRFATENDINLTIASQRDYVLKGARQKWPECFIGQQVTFSASTNVLAQPRNAHEAMLAFAAENNIQWKTMEDFKKIEEGAMRKWPELYRR